MATIDFETLKAIDLYLEEFYPRSKEAGKKLADVQLKKAQIRGLETLITSTTRFSEICNFIKNQAGRERSQDRKWRDQAPSLLDQLTSLEEEAHRLGGDDPAKIMEVKLRLARGWARQVVTSYLYALAEAGL